MTPSTYDLIVSSSTLQHLINVEHAAAQMNRVLTPGGYVFPDDLVGDSRGASRAASGERRT